MECKVYTLAELGKLGIEEIGTIFTSMHIFGKGDNRYLFKKVEGGLSFHLRYEYDASGVNKGVYFDIGK